MRYKQNKIPLFRRGDFWQNWKVVGFAQEGCQVKGLHTRILFLESVNLKITENLGNFNKNLEKDENLLQNRSTGPQWSGRAIESICLFNGKLTWNFLAQFLLRIIIPFGMRKKTFPLININYNTKETHFKYICYICFGIWNLICYVSHFLGKRNCKDLVVGKRTRI